MCLLIVLNWRIYPGWIIWNPLFIVNFSSLKINHGTGIHNQDFAVWYTTEQAFLMLAWSCKATPSSFWSMHVYLTYEIYLKNGEISKFYHNILDFIHFSCNLWIYCYYYIIIVNWKILYIILRYETEIVLKTTTTTSRHLSKNIIYEFLVVSY